MPSLVWRSFATHNLLLEHPSTLLETSKPTRTTLFHSIYRAETGCSSHGDTTNRFIELASAKIKFNFVNCVQGIRAESEDQTDILEPIINVTNGSLPFLTKHRISERTARCVGWYLKINRSAGCYGYRWLYISSNISVLD